MQNWHRTETTCDVLAQRSMTLRPYVFVCWILNCAFKLFPVLAGGILRRYGKETMEKGV